MKSIELSKINDLSELEEIVKKIVSVPLGVALPTFPSLGGYKCEALNIADSYGFVLCNGQEIKDKNSPLFGKKVPNLNSNVFLKGSSEDNKNQGNKENKADFNHTHNYSHTHKIGEFQIRSNENQKVLEQYFYKIANKNEEPNHDYSIQYTGISHSGGNGDAMRLISMPHVLNEIYSSGVWGEAVNGTLEKAETSAITNYSSMNIEPENISTIYIIRIR